MPPTQLLIVYCLLIIAASLAGGWLPLLVRLTHQRMQLAISVVAGFMLGVALLHMLPHALRDAPAEPTMGFVLLGLLVMFFLERFFSYHHHELPDDQHEHDHDHGHEQEQGGQLSWGGATIGMALHSIIAGVALASAVFVGGAPGGGTAGAGGLAVFLVIFMHKPLDSLTVITLTTKRGWSSKSRHLLNGLFALAVPLGAALFLLGFAGAIDQSPTFVAYALAFSAGTFLCISLSDLLPELHFHHHDRGKLSAALLLGLVLAWVAASFEHHTHGHEDHGGHVPRTVHDHDR